MSVNLTREQAEQRPDVYASMPPERRAVLEKPYAPSWVYTPVSGWERLEKSDAPASWSLERGRVGFVWGFGCGVLFASAFWIFV